MMKKYIKLTSIICAVVLAVMTFVSKSVYNSNLPKITAVNLMQTTVSREVDTVGKIFFNGEVDVVLDGNWRVTEVFVADGDEVQKGDVLLMFDTYASIIERKSIELEILKLNNTLDSLDELKPQASSERLSIDRSRDELLASLELAKLRLDYSIENAPPENGLLAPKDGIVYGLSVEKGDIVVRNTTMLTIIPSDYETPMLRFSLSPSDGEVIGDGAQVHAVFEVVLTDEDGNKSFSRRTVLGEVTGSVLRSNMLDCTAKLRTFDGHPVIGQDAALRVVLTGEIQEYVIPLGCIFTLWDKTTVVYEIRTRPGLFGDECYLKEITVDILYDNGRYASIKADDLYWGMKVAGDFSRAVGNGSVVWVR